MSDSGENGRPVTRRVPRAMDTDVPETIGRSFRVVRKIGEGGMGVVYEVEHVRMRKRFAAKVILDRYARDREAIRRLEVEAIAASRIESPHIVQVTHLDTEGDVTYVIMELLRGRSLADAIQGGAMPLPLAVEIARQVARGLSAAHGAGIVHRDLKPENIFLTERDGVLHVKILDFGISKIVDAERPEADLTRTGQVIGTPLYLSPEQARGLAGIDGRTDIYALGAILYEMATGEPVFTAPSTVDLMHRHMHEKPVPPGRKNPAVDGRLEAVIMRCLEKDAGRRYQTAQEIVDALREVHAAPLAESMVREATTPGWAATGQASTPGATPEPRSPLARRLWIAATLAALAAIVAAAYLLLGEWGARGKGAAPAPVAATRDAGTAPTPGKAIAERRLTALPPDFDVSGIAISPDGKTFAYCDTEGFWVQPMSGGPRRSVPVDGALSGWAISPDGKTIAYCDTEGLWVQPMSGGPRRSVPMDGIEPGTAYLADFSRDGESLLVTAEVAGVTQLLSIAIDDGITRLLLTFEVERVTRLHEGLRLSPDRKRMAFIVGDDLLVADSGGAEVRSVFTNCGNCTSFEWSPDGRFLALMIGCNIKTKPGITIVSVDGIESWTLLVDACVCQPAYQTLLAWPDQDRILYSATTKAGEEAGSVLLEARLDRDARLLGAPRVLFRWTGSYVGEAAIQSGARRMLFTKIETSMDVYVARLGKDGSSLEPPRRLSMDDRQDRPSGWTSDGRVLFMSDRLGTWDIFVQSPDEAEPALLAGGPEWETWAGQAGTTAVLYWKMDVDGDAWDGTARLVRRDLPSGESREILSSEAELNVNRFVAPPPITLVFECPRLAPGRCILSAQRADVLEFSWLDPVSGELSRPFHEEQCFSRGSSGLDPAWSVSPSGESIALVNWQNQLRVLDIRSGEVAEHVISEPGNPTYVTWSHDGSYLVVAAQAETAFGRLLRCDLEGNAEILWSSETDWIGQPHVSDDGQQVAFMSFTLDSDLWLLEGF